MQQNFTDVLPFTQYDPVDEVALFSQNGTGLGGRFVVLETGNQNPDLTAGTYVSATPGYNYPYVTDLRYEAPRKFKLAPSGSLKLNVLGLTLYGTAEYDQNGQKLILNPYRKAELGVVYSGEVSNVLTDGIIRLKSSAYSGIPTPGNVAVVSSVGDGTLQLFNAATIVANTAASSGSLAWPTLSHVVAKCISTSGTSTFASYADFKLVLK